MNENKLAFLSLNNRFFEFQSLDHLIEIVSDMSSFCQIAQMMIFFPLKLVPVPFKLQEGEVRIISLSQCQSYFDMKTITPRMLCAGYDAGTVDSCMVTKTSIISVLFLSEKRFHF